MSPERAIRALLLLGLAELVAGETGLADRAGLGLGRIRDYVRAREHPVHVQDIFAAHRRFFKPREAGENISFRRAHFDLTALTESTISPQGEGHEKLQLAPET